MDIRVALLKRKKLERKELRSILGISDDICTWGCCQLLTRKWHQQLFFFTPYSERGKGLIPALPISFSLLRYHHLP